MIDSNNPSVPNAGADFYLDFSQYNKLRKLNQGDENQALAAAAKQMEGIFLNMMLQSMREANSAFSEGSMFESRETDFYRGMYDKQLASNISNGNGIGLAELIVKQLSKPGSDNSNQKSYDISNYLKARVPSVSINAEENKKADQLDSASSIESTTADSLGQASWDSPKNFIETIYPYAEKAANQLGIGVKAVLAQAVLETGWGKHVMPNGKGECSNNFFGIKADTRWQGDVTRKNTLEYRNGIAAKEVAPFRSYSSLKEAFEDYVSFLKNSTRYSGAVEKNLDEKQWGYELQRSGYATDPNYGNKIANIIDSDILQSVVQQESKKI